MIPAIEPYAHAAGRLCAELGVWATLVFFSSFFVAAVRGAARRQALRRFAAGLKPGKGLWL